MAAFPMPAPSITLFVEQRWEIATKNSSNEIIVRQTGAYEGGVRSPGFLHLPGLLGDGRDFPGLVHVSDFFPTLSSIVAHVSSLPLTSYHFSKEKSRDKSIQTSKLDNIDGVDLFPAMLSRYTWSPG